MWWEFLCVSLQGCFILHDRSFSWLMDMFMECIFVWPYVWVCAHMCASVHTCEHMWSLEVDFSCLPLPLAQFFALRQHLSLKLELSEWLAGLASEVPPRAGIAHTCFNVHVFKLCLGSKLRTSCLIQQAPQPQSPPQPLSEPFY